MNALLKTLSLVALGLTVVPAFLVFGGVIVWEMHAGLMLAGAILWFATAPFWMGEAKPKLGLWKKRRIE